MSSVQPGHALSVKFAMSPSMLAYDLESTNGRQTRCFIWVNDKIHTFLQQDLPIHHFLQYMNDDRTTAGKRFSPQELALATSGAGRKLSTLMGVFLGKPLHAEKYNAEIGSVLKAKSLQTAVPVVAQLGIHAKYVVSRQGGAHDSDYYVLLNRDDNGICSCLQVPESLHKSILLFKVWTPGVSSFMASVVENPTHKRDAADSDEESFSKLHVNKRVARLAKISAPVIEADTSLPPPEGSVSLTTTRTESAIAKKPTDDDHVYGETQSLLTKSSGAVEYDTDISEVDRSKVVRETVAQRFISAGIESTEERIHSVHAFRQIMMRSIAASYQAMMDHLKLNDEIDRVTLHGTVVMDGDISSPVHVAELQSLKKFELDAQSFLRRAESEGSGATISDVNEVQKTIVIDVVKEHMAKLLSHEEHFRTPLHQLGTHLTVVELRAWKQDIFDCYAADMVAVAQKLFDLSLEPLETSLKL